MQKDYNKFYNQNYPNIPQIIPEYWHTNKETQIIQNCNNQPWTDPEFPPEYQSLIGPDSSNVPSCYSDFEWTRARDLLNNNYQVFQDIGPNDVLQGMVGDCYLMCALSAIAERPGLVKRLIDTKEVNSEGVYAVWLNISGKWREIVVDEYFPSRNGKFMMALTKEDEIWPMLIEKAYAKFFGGYNTISGGFEWHALRDLTGAPVEMYRCSALEIDQVWKLLSDADQRGYIMTGGISGGSGGTGGETLRDDGLAGGHAYSIIDTAEVTGSDGRQARIVKIRNPWGNKTEWKGDWSDDSYLWTEEVRQQVGPPIREDGTFWMSIEDFDRRFQRFGICKVNSDFEFNGVEVSGGKRDTLIKFEIQNPGEYTISIDQPDGREFQRQIPASPITVVIGRISGSGVDVLDSKYTDERQLFITLYLEPGEYAALVEASWTHNKANSYIFSTYGPGDGYVQIYEDRAIMDELSKTGGGKKGNSYPFGGDGGIWGGDKSWFDINPFDGNEGIFNIDINDFRVIGGWFGIGGGGSKGVGFGSSIWNMISGGKNFNGGGGGFGFGDLFGGGYSTPVQENFQNGIIFFL